MPHDREKLLSVFAVHRDEILRFLTRRLGNVALAEDLTQETWLRVATANGTGEIGNPRSYLFRIASNLAFDYQRNGARRLEVPASDSMVSAVPDPYPSPEAAAVHRSELDRLLAVVDGLTPRRREIFILAKFEGLTYAAIAERLGLSRNTVVTHMVAALSAIEREMDPKKNH